MDFDNQNVLVTGGAGFLGSHLVDRLLKEPCKRVIALDNMFLGKERNLDQARKAGSRFKLYRDDASDHQALEEVLSKNDIDIVYNLAVVPVLFSIDRPYRTCLTNVKIVLELAELLRKDRYETLIHFSSSEAYGSAVRMPMKEDHPLNPMHAYGASKAASDQIILSYTNCYGIDSAIIRPFNTYGPRQNEKAYAAIVPITIRHILAGRPPVIWGDGNQTRDYSFVSDIIESAARIYKSSASRGRVTNVGSGVETSVRDLTAMISRLMNFSRPPRWSHARQGEVRRMRSDIRFAKEQSILPKKRVSLREGLRTTISWYIKGR